MKSRSYVLPAVESQGKNKAIGKVRFMLLWRQHVQEQQIAAHQLVSKVKELYENMILSNSTVEWLLTPQLWLSGWIGWFCGSHCTRCDCWPSFSLPLSQAICEEPKQRDGHESGYQGYNGKRTHVFGSRGETALVNTCSSPVPQHPLYQIWGDDRS